MKKHLLSVIFLFVITITAFSQSQSSRTIPKDWFLLDPELDSLQGVSANRTYAKKSALTHHNRRRN